MNNSRQRISFGNSCATDFEMEGRMSPIFRNNVYWTNTIVALTVLMTYQAVMKMGKKRLFSKTTRNLFFFCMFYYIIHDVYFAWTLNWSFYRSITQPHDPCKIMFTGKECFSAYILGIFLRVLLVYSQCAVTIERMVVTVLPNSDLLNSATLNILTFLMSVVTTSLLKPAEPSVYNSPNCLQQLYVGMHAIKNLIWVLIVYDFSCFPLNCAITLWYRKKFQSIQIKEYDLKSRHKYKNNMTSCMIVSIISLVQVIIYTFHLVSVYTVLKMYTDEHGLFFQCNYALWCYTFPLAGLALPCSIVLSFTAMSIKRNNKIAVMQTTSATSTQEAYFKDLANSWNV